MNAATSPTALETILLVEDEPDIRMIATMSLGQLGGWRVIEASSGCEAVETATSGRPDLILLDMMMPGMDGLETLRALRADEATRRIPVLFMTARVQEREIEEYVSAGALGVIRKPFDPMALPTLIRELWARP